MVDPTKSQIGQVLQIYEAVSKTQKVCRALTMYGIDYTVIGGAAIALHSNDDHYKLDVVVDKPVVETAEIAKYVVRRSINKKTKSTRVAVMKLHNTTITFYMLGSPNFPSKKIKKVLVKGIWCISMEDAMDMMPADKWRVKTYKKVFLTIPNMKFSFIKNLKTKDARIDFLEAWMDAFDLEETWYGKHRAFLIKVINDTVGTFKINFKFPKFTGQLQKEVRAKEIKVAKDHESEDDYELEDF